MLTSKVDDLINANFHIITVPTPVNKSNNPDLIFLKNALVSISFYLKKNDIIILESTVYPGCTEEFCVPILEKISKLSVLNERNLKKVKNYSSWYIV